MKKIKEILFFIPVVIFFASCEVEFTPNAEWKNIPVVYCLLDQDEDTTWVRVQRCYLVDDNIYNYGQNTDSINYPQGSITVSLLAYENGVLKDSMDFHYVERSRDSGNFASASQPLYWFETRNRLKENYTYVLTVRNATDGSILATTDPISLICQRKENGKYIPLILKPEVHVFNGDTNYDISGLKFNKYVGHEAYCEIQWNTMENARLYQPMVRLYYAVNGSTQHIDLFCPKIVSKTTVNYARSQFLADVKSKLEGDTTSKQYLARVDLYLTCCTEELNVYMSNTTNSAVDSRAQGAFNNIHGGVGVFAARRIHLYKRMPADNSMVEDRGLLYFLKELGVGF